MLAAEWSSVAMRKLAAVCERAIGRTDSRAASNRSKGFLLSGPWVVPKSLKHDMAPEHLLQISSRGLGRCARLQLGPLAR